MPPELAEQLKKKAKEAHLSMNRVILESLMESLERWDRSGKRTKISRLKT
jgi:predicted HicB family RNase H-like nuclease